MGIGNVTFQTSDSTVVDYWPRFSPTGDQVLFSRQDSPQTGGPYKLWTVPVAGGSPSPFPAIDVGETRSDWSWNTTLTQHQIAFTGESVAGGFLYVVNADGSDPQMIQPPNTGTQVDYPSWYPDGVNVAVVDYGDVPNSPTGLLRKINTQTNTAEALTSLSDIYAGEPSVSRDGTTIAFAGQRPCGAYDQNNNQIWLLDQQGGLTQLDPQEGRTPNWSPNDLWLSYETTRYCSGGLYAIIVESAQGGQAVQLTDCSLNGNHSVWSPDGQWIAFSAVLPGVACFSNGVCPRGIALIPAPAMSMTP